MVLNWIFADTGEKWVLTLENSALTFVGPDRESVEAHATLLLARTVLNDITMGNLT